MKKETVVAYIAGIIDGEGCITICRRKIKRLKTNNWYYEPQIIIANTYKELLDFCVENYGGWIVVLGKYGLGNKQNYQWKVTGDKMRSVLKDVLSYLIIKKKQAEIVLSFPSYMSTSWGNQISKGRSQEELKKQEDLWIEIRKLNRGFRKIGSVGIKKIEGGGVGE